MRPAPPATWLRRASTLVPTRDRGLLLLGLALHLTVALFFGHVYDMRIFMATGYLVGTGQNPYVPQDLHSVFNNPAFQGITSVGYPPPWPLALGLLYRVSFAIFPNLLFYSLVIKLPIVAANIGLAYMVSSLLRRLGAAEAVRRRAWLFMLFNPLLLIFTSAWGQFDSIVALLALEALVLLTDGKLTASAALLALATSFKPTPLPLLPLILITLAGESFKRALHYAAVLGAGLLVFCVVPFMALGWDPTIILQHWNAHFAVGGGMSFMTFYELVRDRYDLPGNWWLLGMAWLPALGAALLAFRGSRRGLVPLLSQSLGLVLVFYLTRSWLSEPNLALLLPWVVILAAVGELDSVAPAAIVVLALIFSVFNSSIPQLLFPGFPDIMARLLRTANNYRSVRLGARIVTVILWQIAGWWMVSTCYRQNRLAPQTAHGRDSVVAA